jgi:hypothetical protein
MDDLLEILVLTISSKHRDAQSTKKRSSKAVAEIYFWPIRLAVIWYSLIVDNFSSV